MIMRIGFQSGSVIDVPVEEFTISRSTVSGQLAKLSWTTDGDIAPKFVDVDRIEFVIRVDENDPSEEGEAES